MSILKIDKLSKSYSAFQLKQLSFSLEEGRIMGLIGKNGAGKSTTLKAMVNLVNPDSGVIEMFGMNFKENEETCKQQLGIVLGGIDFYRFKKLAAVTAVTRRFYQNWDQSKYEKYMKMFELDETKRVNQLSAGMRVKYSIALALSHHARLFLFDEPTSGLDPVSRDELLELFRMLVQDGTRSILYSTHITSDLERCADDITYIHDGELLASAETNQFIGSFQNLKTVEDQEDLSLEEIMIRKERSYRNAEFTL